ncbi:MAG: globin [Rhizomicrobium sp.]
MSVHPIETSLELVSERCGDLTPFVYARLFELYPDMKPLFRRDTNDAVKGEMLARVFEAILDFIGDNRYASHLIQCEVVTHSGYDVPPEIFRIFFGVVASTIRERLGADWTAAFEAAWEKLLGELDYFVTHPDQNETGALQRIRDAPPIRF